MISDVPSKPDVLKREDDEVSTFNVYGLYKGLLLEIVDRKVCRGFKSQVNLVQSTGQVFKSFYSFISLTIIQGFYSVSTFSVLSPQISLFVRTNL